MRTPTKPTTQVILAAILTAQWGEVPPGTKIDVLRVERRYNRPDYLAYGGSVSKPFPDMVTFDAYFLCVNPADRERVVALLAEPL